MNDGCPLKTIGGGIQNILAFFFLVIPFGVVFLFFVFNAVSLADDVKSDDLMEEALSAIAAGKKDLGIRKDLNSNGRMNRFDRWIERPLTRPRGNPGGCPSALSSGAKPCPVVEGVGFPGGNWRCIAPAQW